MSFCWSLSSSLILSFYGAAYASLIIVQGSSAHVALQILRAAEKPPRSAVTGHSDRPCSHCFLVGMRRCGTGGAGSEHREAVSINCTL